MKLVKSEIKIKKWTKLLILLAVIAAAVSGWMVVRGSKKKAVSAAAASQKTAVVERRSITSELSSSGTLAAKDTYSITSMVEGEVLTADFEEGDQVEKDQVLYEIDKSSMETELTNAGSSLNRSQNSYADALEDYNQALSDYSGNTYKATDTGYIRELYIHVGDKVGQNTKLADIYSDDMMELRIPFLSGEAELITPGMEAVLTLIDSEEELTGTVRAVANRVETLSGGRLVKYVTIDVVNPGGLMTTTSAVARIGEMVGSETGVFKAATDTTMNADLAVNVEVEQLLVNAGACSL